MLYAYLLSKSDMRMQDALKELRKSLDKAYELYHYLLLLPVELTRLQELRIDNARNKYLPTPEDLNPNMKFVENRFVAKMRQSEMMQEFLKTAPLSWRKNDIYLRLTLDKILNSDIYKAYMETPQSDLASDCELWKDLMKKVIFPDDELCDVLEEESVYWNDDLETIGTFVLKTIRRFADDGYDKLLPQFKDEEDSRYSERLFRNAAEHESEYMALIDKFVVKDSWDTERLAFMDVVILLTAIAEVENEPSVPTKVTLNEYIEISKYYSTTKSGAFVNGILNSIINYLKKEGLLNKE